jgi:hypothetical protein
MGRFGEAPVLPVHQEDEDLFETSSSISGDSDDEAQLSDVEAQQHQFGLQAAPKTVRRLNSDSVFDMSSVKAELPMKKGGLSRYYDGKSQSFACMSEVRCLEDLRKKERPYKKIKSDVDLDGNQEACPAPGPNSKGTAKPSGGSCANLMARNSTTTNMLYRPPPIPVNKSAYHQ